MTSNLFECPSEEIASFVDGEIDVEAQSRLESHFRECGVCSAELNRQKQFLLGLESGLRSGDEFVLPPDFTKRILANAESTVSGLRRPGERFNAIFILSGLLLFLLFALGSDAGRFVDRAAGVFEQVSAVGGFFGHLFFAAFIGLSIILRTFAAQLRFEVAGTIMLVVLFGLMVVYFSRKVVGLRRA